jgi:outer membrane protein OmpA-like peptidoglycan-associated protein
MEHEEKLFAVTGGLLAGALVFLTTGTVHPYARIAIILLLIAATMVAGSYWWKGFRHSPTHAVKPVRTVGMLLVVAVLIALGGYVMMALGDVKRVSSTPPPRARDAVAAAREKTQGWWLFGLSAVFGAGAIFLFWKKRPVAATATALLSLAVNGATLVKMDKFVDKLELGLTQNVQEESHPPPIADPQPPPAPETFALIATDTIGPFAPGRADLNNVQKARIASLRDNVALRATITFAVVVGHVDRRALKPATAKEYASNQGLALQRALAVRNILGDQLAAITTLGGPSKTRMPVTEPDLESDRRVEVFYFGTRH